MRTFSIQISGDMSLEPKFFFDDSPMNEHEDATELDCAREVSRYIEEHGMSAWLREWNLDDLSVYVGKYPAVLNGIPITEIHAEVSNQEPVPQSPTDSPGQEGR